MRISLFCVAVLASLLMVNANVPLPATIRSVQFAELPSFVEDAVVIITMATDPAQLPVLDAYLNGASAVSLLHVQYETNNRDALVSFIAPVRRTTSTTTTTKRHRVHATTGGSTTGSASVRGSTTGTDEDSSAFQLHRGVAHAFGAVVASGFLAGHPRLATLALLPWVVTNFVSVESATQANQLVITLSVPMGFVVQDVPYFPFEMPLGTSPVTVSWSPYVAPSGSAIVTQSGSRTVIASASSSPPATPTLTPTAPSSNSPTSTISASVGATNSASSSLSATPSVSLSPTASGSSSATLSATPSVSPSPTASGSSSAAVSITPSSSVAPVFSFDCANPTNWYLGAQGESCNQVCSNQGRTFSPLATAHTGNPVCQCFVPTNANPGSNWVNLECCSTDSFSNWGATGGIPDGTWTHPACRIPCVCV